MTTFVWIYLAPLMIVLGVVILCCVYAAIVTTVQSFDEHVRDWWHDNTKI